MQEEVDPVEGEEMDEATTMTLGSWVVPLLPDIMERPGTHQNPMAWMLRYRKQHFRTTIHEVVRRK